MTLLGLVCKSDNMIKSKAVTYSVKKILADYE